MKVNPELNQLFRHSYTKPTVREENEAGLVVGICFILACVILFMAIAMGGA